MLFSTVASTLLVALVVAPAASLPTADSPSHLEKRGSFKGKATWYDVGLGACGKRNTNKQPIIAMNKSQYKKSVCGKWVTIKAGKKSARGYVEDMCPGCKKGHLDISPTLFKKLAPLSKGVISINWSAGSVKRSVDDEDEDDGPVEKVDEDLDDIFDAADELTEADLL